MNVETNRTIPFNKEDVKKYLDECIKYWRKEHLNNKEMARYYIDAFQSVRVSLFNELLSDEES